MRSYFLARPLVILGADPPIHAPATIAGTAHSFIIISGTEDRKLKAAERLWPGMPITNSTLLLTLARLKAEEILKRK